jgi:imidazole glycerol-phosphate synthase subunit HisH
MQKITITDYGMGNLHSVERKLQRIGAKAIVTSRPEDILIAEKLVLPGVGHFKTAMENLNRHGLAEALNEAVIKKGTPILGICLGMQLFAKRSEEGDSRGLGWIDADVVRFKVEDTLRHKVPHIGWNAAEIVRDGSLMRRSTDAEEFYFVHSYHLVCHDLQDVLCETEYAYPFTSGIARGNIFGVQFHPEKSHDAGEKLLRNFVEL